MVKVAINGFGRIGRLALRKMIEQTDKFEVVLLSQGETIFTQKKPQS